MKSKIDFKSEVREALDPVLVKYMGKASFLEVADALLDVAARWTAMGVRAEKELETKSKRKR